MQENLSKMLEEAKAQLHFDHWRNMVLARCERKGILIQKAE